MDNHKYDRRGAGDEGRFAQELYDLSCQEAGRKYREASIKEDCEGIDRYIGDKAVDVKARKFRMPINTCWIEISAAGKSVGTGWVYKPKWIAQLMVFEEKKMLTNCIFGEYHTSDLVDLMKEKVDFNSKADCGKVNQLYTRWTDGQHRGTMTVITYEDLESLKSFSKLAVPRYKWDEVRRIYGLLGIKQA